MATSSPSIGSFLARAWFPLALIILLLLALPGVVFAILHLCGWEAEVNDWLQENFQVSFLLALPDYWGVVLLLLPLLLILLYFLKLKRKPLRVPSTYLWRKSIEDLHVNSLFQWLRQNILLVLQLLTLLVLIYAVLGLRIHGNLTRGKHYILMIDTSASMSATDLGISRLEWAKKEALKEIDAATDEDNGMVIVFNSKATTLQPYTKNRGLLREAVNSIQPTQRVTRIEEALTLADSLANVLRSGEDIAARPENEEPGKERTYVQPKGIPTEVFLFSDGRFPDLSEAALAALNSRQAGNTSALGNLTLRYRRAGKPAASDVNNIGIVNLSAVRVADAPGRPTSPERTRLEVLVVVRNFRPIQYDREDVPLDQRKVIKTPVKVKLDVLTGGQVTHTFQETIKVAGRLYVPADPKKDEPGKDETGEAAVSFSLPPLDIRSNSIVHVGLVGIQDDFALDDEAWLVVGALRKARILRVGPNNEILQAFFNQPALKKIAAVETYSPEDLQGRYRQAARSGEYDLIIFDRCAPLEREDMPQANTLFIDTPPPPWQKGKTVLKNPIVMVSDRDHPLIRQLTTLWDIGLVGAHRFHPLECLQEKYRQEYTLDPADRNKKMLPPVKKLLEAPGNVPLLFTLARGSYTDVVLTFPLLNEKGDLVTNWPLQPSFPLFLRNVLYELGNVHDDARGETVQPGEPVLLRPEAGIRTLTITSPRGLTRKLERGNRPEFLYADTEQVGIYDVLHDDQPPTRRAFAVNLLDSLESNIHPRDEIRIGPDVVSAGRDRPTPQEIWKWVVLLALVLLIVEWYIYNRRVQI